MVEAGDYPAVQDWIATSVHYQKAMSCWLDESKCEDEKQEKAPLWRRFMACAFSLECG